VHDLLFAPVIAGYWKHREIWDGTYTLDDLLDIIEVMEVKNENERRQREYDEMMAKIRKGGV
jgi:hypothetical protein